MSDEIIKVSNLTYDYGNGRGIYDFDFSVNKGEVFGIVGSNGSGKTTTLRNLMGFIKPNKGKCSILELDCNKDSKEIMKHVGYVPGEIDFPDVGTGNDFLKIQAEFLGIKDKEYINYLIDIFKLDTRASLKRMSKGMKQKTALVCAFMSKPEILLLDEPSTGLDPLMRDNLIELILKTKEDDTTIVMSSHIFKELDDTADRVLFIDKGKQIDIVDKNRYEKESPNIYRIGFKSPGEYVRFINNTTFDIRHTNEKYLHMDIEVSSCLVNDLFNEMKGFDIRYIKYKPTTLEDYYINILEKGGKYCA